MSYFENFMKANKLMVILAGQHDAINPQIR